MDDEESTWTEAEVSSTNFPALPKDENLIPFDVSRLSSNTFFVDAASISMGKDEVIRYTLVIKSPSGTRNISYEGMRCTTTERRAYAFASNNGNWSPSRRSGWQTIQGNSLNRHYAALYASYFCPPGAEIISATAAISILRKGGIAPPP